jgi:hypothetical protein
MARAGKHEINSTVNKLDLANCSAISRSAPRGLTENNHRQDLRPVHSSKLDILRTKTSALIAAHTTYLCRQDEPNTSNGRVGVSFVRFNFDQNHLMDRIARLTARFAQATITKMNT